MILQSCGAGAVLTLAKFRSFPSQSRPHSTPSSAGSGADSLSAAFVEGEEEEEDDEEERGQDSDGAEAGGEEGGGAISTSVVVLFHSHV